jgi:phage N-6-adenine-methyltransferase
VSPRFSPPTYEELGLDARESGFFKKLAKAAPEAFEAHITGSIERGEKLTLRGAVAAASHAKDYDGDESYTPDLYVDLARAVMGSIGLDPASCELGQQVVRAKTFFTKEDEGLTQSWGGWGPLWLNPPFSPGLIEAFVEKLLAEMRAPGAPDQAIVLVNASTETAWFHALANAAAHVCFPGTRINFDQPDGDRRKKTKGNRYAQAFFYFGDEAGVLRFRAEFSNIGLVGRLEGA